MFSLLFNLKSIHNDLKHCFTFYRSVTFNWWIKQSLWIALIVTFDFLSDNTIFNASQGITDYSSIKSFKVTFSVRKKKKLL